jgi:uncharacterized membrane protein
MRWEDTIDIDAPPELLWRATIDVTQWPSFIPTVTSVERLDSGPLAVGSKARIKQPAQLPAVWTVTRLDPVRDFAWQTRRLGMTMTGTHRIEPLPGGCRNVLGVELTGPGATLLGALIGGQVRKAILAENRAFRDAVQRMADGTSAR